MFPYNLLKQQTRGFMPETHKKHVYRDLFTLVLEVIDIRS